MTAPRFIIRRAAGDALSPWYLFDTHDPSKPFYRRTSQPECLMTAETILYMSFRAKRYPHAVYSDSIYPTPSGWNIDPASLRTPPKQHVWTPSPQPAVQIDASLIRIQSDDPDLFAGGRIPAYQLTTTALAPVHPEEEVIARVKKRLEENHADDARYNYLREKAIKRDRAAHALKIDPAMYSDNADYQRSQQESLEQRRAPDTHTRKFFHRLWKALTS